MGKFALISCGKKKARTRQKAKDLYEGSLFKKSRKYAEDSYDGWFILSALHGLVHPENELDPYDYTLVGKSKDELVRWSDGVAKSIEEIIPKGSHIDVYAGKEYRRYLLPKLTALGYSVRVPLEGMGIGKQLSWLSSKVK